MLHRPNELISKDNEALPNHVYCKFHVYHIIISIIHSIDHGPTLFRSNFVFHNIIQYIRPYIDRMYSKTSMIAQNRILYFNISIIS